MDSSGKFAYNYDNRIVRKISAVLEGCYAEHISGRNGSGNLLSACIL